MTKERPSYDETWVWKRERARQEARKQEADRMQPEQDGDITVWPIFTSKGKEIR